MTTQPDDDFDLRTFMERPVWLDDANCRGLDPELFFPARGDSTRQAKAVCHECDVQAECLAYAMNLGEKFGIWGGLSERQRRVLRRQAAVELGGAARGPIAGSTARPIDHGTNAGAAAHHRRGETPCDDRKRAHALNHLERKQAAS